MAEVNVCGQIVRIIFFILNILSALFAVALIALGSYVVHHRGDFSGSYVVTGAAILIVAGIVGVLIVAAGMLGVLFLSRLWLGIYILSLGFVVLLEITGCVLGAVFRGRITDEIGNTALDNIERYLPPENPKHSKSVNEIVDNFQNGDNCCGWNSTSNWFPNSPYYNETGRYPESCSCTASLPARNCTQVTVRNGTQQIWATPCEEAITSLFKRNLAIVAGIGGTFGIIQIIPLFLGCCLCCLIRKEGTVHKRLA